MIRRSPDAAEEVFISDIKSLLSSLMYSRNRIKIIRNRYLLLQRILREHMPVMDILTVFAFGFYCIVFSHFLKDFGRKDAAGCIKTAACC